MGRTKLISIVLLFVALNWTFSDACSSWLKSSQENATIKSQSAMTTSPTSLKTRSLSTKSLSEEIVTARINDGRLESINTKFDEETKKIKELKLKSFFLGGCKIIDKQQWCKNGGKCAISGMNIVCECLSGFEGSQCERKIE